MELDIRRLTPAMWQEYLYFFDEVAFVDHPEWSQCYCLASHFEPSWDEEDAGRENPWRDRAMRFVQEGKLQGYLAYVDGQAVGWCNANDRSHYAALKCGNADEGKKIKSAVCFLVAPDMRGKGVATQMLERVCRDAQAEGYDCAEGYPIEGEWNVYAAHHGTRALFEKCGFTACIQADGKCVMRRELKVR